MSAVSANENTTQLNENTDNSNDLVKNSAGDEILKENELTITDRENPNSTTIYVNEGKTVNWDYNGASLSSDSDEIILNINGKDIGTVSYSGYAKSNGISYTFQNAGTYDVFVSTSVLGFWKFSSNTLRYIVGSGGEINPDKIYQTSLSLFDNETKLTTIVYKQQGSKVAILNNLSSAELGSSIVNLIAGNESGSISEKLSINCNGQDYGEIMTVSPNGEWMNGLSLELTETGWYNITAYYKGNSHLSNATSNTLCYYVPQSGEEIQNTTTTRITVNPQLISLGESTVITPKVFDTGNIEISEGFIEIYVNGAVKSTISAGQTYTLTPTTTGSTEIYARYLSNNNYKSSDSNKVTLTVTQSKTTTTTININPVNVVAYTDTVITPVVRDSQGNTINSGDVEIIINDISVTTIKSGESYTVAFIDSGVHNIYARYLGSNDYGKSTSQTVQLTVRENTAVKSTLTPDNPLGVLSTVKYFDANALNDGDGSKSNPYKFLNSSKIDTSSTNYFAEGEYTLDSSIGGFFGSIFGGVFYGSCEFIGTNPEKTVIRYIGSEEMIKVSSGYYILIEGLTISNATIASDGGEIQLKNAIIENAKGVADKNNNTYGGAVSLTSAPSRLTSDNVTFKNNNAEYGGAIYVGGATAIISNSKFINNTAVQYGGSVAGTDKSKITVLNSDFSHDKSLYDAGASVYVKNAVLTISNTNFTQSESFFGSAVTALNSSTTIDNIIADSNIAGFEGGAVYSMYGSLKITSSTFNRNTAKYGGAIFADNMTSFESADCIFNNNEALYNAGAIFAYANIKTDITNPKYNGNKAGENNDLYQTSAIDLTIFHENSESMIYNPSFTGTLPVKYDLRDYNQVSTIRNQGDSGNCWAYATLAALESCILKATGQEYDLSEGNLKNLAQYFSDYGWKYETNEGGFYRMANGYLTGWLGPVLESEDLTDDKDIISPVIDSLMHVQNILYITRTSYTDNDAIKKAIMDYGAVATEIFFKNSGYYYNPSTGAYYYNDGTEINHAVAIVGWDDTYSRNNFAQTPPGDGAFIIKNSYGNQWGVGNSGFGYVSYYDTAFARFNLPYSTFTYILNDTVKFNKNYQYETSSWTDYFVTGKNTIYYQNVFTSTGNDLLAGFSTYFNGTKTDWEAKIYVNDELKLTQNGVSPEGYYTINLDELIPLQTGDKFKISIKISSDGFASFPISENSMYGSTRMNYVPGCSYFSYDGEEWYDLYDYTVNESYGHRYYSQVACIKAFTTSNGDDSAATKIDFEATSNGITANVKTLNNSPVRTGNVTFLIDNSPYTVNVSNGKAELKIYLKPGEYNISAVYNANNLYNSSDISKYIVIDKKTPVLVIKADSIYYGENLTVNIALTDFNGETIDLPVTVSVDNVTYQAYDKLIISNLKPGNYTVDVKFNETQEYASLNISSNVAVKKLATKLKLNVSDADFAQDITISANLANIQNGTVKIKVNDNEYSIIITNENGFIKIPAPEYGTYTVTGEFEGNDIYDKAYASAVFSTGKTDVSIVTSCNNITEGETAYINVNTPSDAGGALILSLNNKNYIAFIKNTVTTFKITNLNEGKYDYTISYKSNSKYASCEVNSSFYIVKKNNTSPNTNTSVVNNTNTSVTNNTNTTVVNNTNTSENTQPAISYILDAPDVLKFFKGSERFIVTLTDNSGNPLDNASIKISVNGNTYTRTTNKSGIASLALNLNSGVYNVVTTYDNISLNSTVTIKDTITSDDLEKVFKNSSQFYATFTDSEGNLLKNTTVKFNINGVFYERITDLNGRARLNINLEQGEYIITSINPSTGENQARTVKVLSRITGNNDLIKYYRNNSQYVVRLINEDGSVAGENETVTFNINGVFYERKTNSTGHVKLNLNLQDGDYIITAEYKSCKVSNNIKILPVLTADDLTMKYRDGSRFSVKLLDGRGDAFINQRVSFNVNGVFYNRVTDIDGIANLNINLQAGEYIITSSFNGGNIANKITII